MSSEARPVTDEDARIDRARAGDREAIAALYRAHAEAAARWLRAQLGDPSSVDDMVQELFVIAFSRLDRYDGRVPFAAWLHGIALGIARNHMRKQRRRRGLLQRWFAGEAGHGATPQAELEGRALQDALYAALHGLGDARREAFVLRVIEGRSLDEAAAILGVSPKTVSERALAAERTLRATLGGAP